MDGVPIIAKGNQNNTVMLKFDLYVLHFNPMGSKFVLSMNIRRDCILHYIIHTVLNRDMNHILANQEQFESNPLMNILQDFKPYYTIHKKSF